MRLHAAVGFVTPDDEHSGRGDAIRQARRDGLVQARVIRVAYRRSQPGGDSMRTRSLVVGYFPAIFLTKSLTAPGCPTARPIVLGSNATVPYGMLGRAQNLFRQVLDTLRDDIAAGTPMIVPEPSCCASFRDELGQMFPHDADARRLAQQTFTFEEFLDKHASG